MRNFLAQNKKKILSLLGAPVLALALVQTAAAQSLGDWMPLDFNFQAGDLQGYVSLIIRILLIVAGVVAVIYLIIGGYQYVTSAGNAEQAAAGRTTVLNAIIGLVIIFAAYLVIGFVMSQLDISG